MKRRVAVDLSVLRQSRDLRLLVIGELFSGLGSQAALVAIPFQIYLLTDSAALVGLLGIVELVPIVVCSLLGGAIADRIERRRLMLTGQALVTASAITLAATSASGDPPVPLVFALAATLAAGATLDNVTRSAIVPALAKDRLRAALSLTYGLHQVSAVAGPALGGLMIAALGTASAYTAQAIGFVIMMGITLALPRLYPAPSEQAHPPILDSIKEGLTFVRGNSALMGSFAADLVAMTFGMPRALFAVLALTVYDAGATGTGILYASVSAGAVVAALSTGWVEHARWLGRIVIGAVIVWGLAIAAAGLMPSLWPAAALLALAGAADSISAVCRSIINQTVTPEHLRGRMSAIFMLVVTSGPRLGDLEAGVAASLTTAGVAVVSGGLVCVAGVLVIAALFPALAAYDGRVQSGVRA
ncbi:transmembrane secretion effector [Solirubrobacter pauli]|uniref:Transmembrane secretion effector n=1 Tax=Solirubrobacter pauli TaxID=166793 RepID=A0A660L3V6_9ACTN|nr:MFS transporter [Solirubrobacter pauli]RKQ87619.1 transmembrane secretion effector [Solirubrobacter pauli]